MKPNSKHTAEITIMRGERGWFLWSATERMMDDSRCIWTHNSGTYAAATLDEVIEIIRDRFGDEEE